MKITIKRSNLLKTKGQVKLPDLSTKYTDIIFNDALDEALTEILIKKHLEGEDNREKS